MQDLESTESTLWYIRVRFGMVYTKLLKRTRYSKTPFKHNLCIRKDVQLTQSLKMIISATSTFIVSQILAFDLFFIFLLYIMEGIFFNCA